MAFTREQSDELDRMSAARKDELVLSRLEKRTVPELRARVNIVSIGAAVEFAPESNYTLVEIGVIETVRPRGKWMIEIPVLLDEAEVLRSEGMSEGAIAVVLRSRT